MLLDDPVDTPILELIDKKNGIFGGEPPITLFGLLVRKLSLADDHFFLGKVVPHIVDLYKSILEQIGYGNIDGTGLSGSGSPHFL